jgi:hypothetical protein
VGLAVLEKEDNYCVRYFLFSLYFPVSGEIALLYIACTEPMLCFFFLVIAFAFAFAFVFVFRFGDPPFVAVGATTYLLLYYLPLFDHITLYADISSVAGSARS